MLKTVGTQRFQAVKHENPWWKRFFKGYLIQKSLSQTGIHFFAGNRNGRLA